MPFCKDCKRHRESMEPVPFIFSFLKVHFCIPKENKYDCITGKQMKWGYFDKETEDCETKNKECNCPDFEPK